MGCNPAYGVPPASGAHMGTASISAGPRLLGLGAAGLPLALVVARLELALPQEQHRVRALVLASSWSAWGPHFN